MVSLNISLPKTLREYIETQVREGDFSTRSEYLRSLIREDQKRKAEGRIEALLLDGRSSGEPNEVNQAFWDKKRLALASRRRKTRK
jgi:antitoxin ParD1/3/4